MGKFDLNSGSRRSFIANAAMLSATSLLSSRKLSFAARINTKRRDDKVNLKPELIGDWWLIGRTPDELLAPMGAALEKLVEDRRRLNKDLDITYDDSGNILSARLTKVEPVDHHIFKGNDSYWHLWGCIRNTEVGRLLYHWRAKNLEDSPWEETGEVIRCDFSAGECIDDWYGQEWLQSPYFIKENGLYYMFYGGHSTGKDRKGQSIPGNPPSPEMRKVECQICLMTSKDGLTWQRHRDVNGYSRVFIGPGQTRDPCLIKIDKTWYIYYSGDEQNHLKGGVYVRTSEDLVNWSDYKLVYHDSTFGGTTWQHECPHVVYRAGYFYLFITENYSLARSHVYRSENPLDFGTDTASAQALYVGALACAAPELYEFEGKCYVSSNHNPPLGTQMCRMHWVPE